MLTIVPHPLHDLRAFVTTWPQPLGSMESPAWLQELATVEAEAPFSPFDDTIKKSVRDLLRHGGLNPAGRSKPCSEYIRGVAAQEALTRHQPRCGRHQPGNERPTWWTAALRRAPAGAPMSHPRARSHPPRHGP